MGRGVRGSESVAVSDAPSQAKPSVKRKVRPAPWESSKKWDVPWDARTYIFSTRHGCFSVAWQPWDVERDKNGKITQILATAAPENPNGEPLLSYADAKRAYDAAAEKDIPLKRTVAKIIDRRKLSGEVLERLATCPEVWPTTSKSAQLQQVEEKTAAAAAFWDEIDKE